MAAHVSHGLAPPMTGRISRRTALGMAGSALVAGLSGFGPGIVGAVSQIRRRETVTVTSRGASLAGLRAALREVASYGGGTVRLEARSIAIDTADLIATGPIMLPENVVIEGEGARLTFLGEAPAPPLFVAQDVSQITLRHLTATGNGRGIADTRSGGFAVFVLSSAARGDMEGIRLENMTLTGFRAERWIQFLQRNTAGHRMTGVRISDLQVANGQSLGTDSIGVSAAPLWLHGVSGEIDDVEVRRLTVRAATLKQGIVLFHKVRRVTIDTVEIDDAGRTGARDDAGAYAIMAYADPGEMTDVAITAATIRRPRSAGIYLRGAQRVRVIGATIDGQTDAVTTNLPKGAIALNGCSDITIANCTLTGNRFDLSVADGGIRALALDVRELRTQGSDTSVILAISPGRGPVVGARFTGCQLSGRDRVVRVMNEQVPGRWYDDVAIVGGTLRSETAANVVELTQQRPTSASGYRIEDTTIQANNVGIMAAGLRGSLAIKNTTVEGLGRMDYGIVADDCPGLDWEGVTFRNIAGGYAYTARPSRRAASGTLRGLRFDAVARPFAVGSLTPQPER